MKTIVHCGQLFAGTGNEAVAGQTIVIEAGLISFVGPKRGAPAPNPGDVVVDHSDRFVMPGLSDLHVHLSYGNAMGQEDIDLYATAEYRALRALYAAQRMLTAGYTALLDPASSGLVSSSLRDAIFTGMFPGPRITAAGPAITSRLGLYDYYPSWIGCPPQSSGVLVKSLPEAIEEIRRQTKEGIDVIKLAMDGTLGDKKRGLYAAFDLDETKAMVREAQRLGRRVGVHTRGTEGALYAAKAGVDIIYHASRISEEGIRAALDSGCHICPSLSLLVNNIQFAQKGDPSESWWPDIQRAEFAASRVNLRRAREAGIPFVFGSESGFAVTPYGEWEPKELQIMTDYLGFSPGEALRIATGDNRRLLRDGDQYDSLAPGKKADFVVLSGDPTTDIKVLMRPGVIVETWLDGQPIQVPKRPPEIPRHYRELAQGMWTTLYTRSAIEGRKLAPLSLDPARDEALDGEMMGSIQ